MLRRRKKNDKIYVLSNPFNNYHIFSIWINIRTYRKRQKNISVQCRQCSAILFWNRSRDCSVYTTLEDGVAGVRRYRCSSTTWLLFCLFGVKGVKGTAKSSLPQNDQKHAQDYRKCAKSRHSAEIATQGTWNFGPILQKKRNYHTPAA